MFFCKVKLSGLLATVLLISLGSSESVNAEKIYKWVDENGKVHFSSRPPKDKLDELKPIKLNNSNVIENSYRVKTLQELKAANIPITPELREKALAEEERRLLEKQQREAKIAADKKREKEEARLRELNRFNQQTAERNRKNKECEKRPWMKDCPRRDWSKISEEQKAAENKARLKWERNERLGRND